MYNQLNLMFLDWGWSKKALQELRNLHQGSRLFNELLADLNQLLMEARGHSWSDKVKKNYLDSALSYKVEGALISITKEETFTDYCRQVQQVAN
jgi:phage portal protein BeeE